MRQSKYHFIFWCIYASYTIITDNLIYGSIPFFEHLLSITLHQVFIFYISLLFLKYASFRNFPKAVLTILGFCLCFTLFVLVSYFYFEVFIKLVNSEDYKPIKTGRFLLTSFAWFLNFFIWAGAYHFLTLFAEKEKTLRIRNQALEKKQLLTQSAFLRSQINPHFLQNTLNFLYGKTRKHAAELAEGVLLLSDIMRYSLEATKSDDDLTPLKEEMEHLKNLMKLQQLRFSNRLHVELSTTGNWQQLKIPPLTLITLAENAFKYGELEDDKNPVTIHLHVTDNEQQLQFTVANKKKQGPVEVSYGIGHENIRNRLAMQHGGNFELRTKNEQDYYTVYLTINLH